MVKTWKEPRQTLPMGESLLAAGIGATEDIERFSEGYENTPLHELRTYAPSKFVKTQQRWCNNFIAESYSNKNLDSEKTKTYFVIMLNAINDNAGHSPFDTKDILNWTDAKNLSDGSLQRKALSWMVCLGILESRHIKYLDGDGKEKIKYVFVKKQEINPCDSIVDGKCNFNWKEAALTDYFPPEHRERVEEDGE